MKRQGFDSEKYLSMQSARIEERIKEFGGKLYLEFGGKLFDDFHAARVLPGFAPDNKIKMLEKLKDRAEIVIVISAQDIANGLELGYSMKLLAIGKNSEKGIEVRIGRCSVADTR